MEKRLDGSIKGTDELTHIILIYLIFIYRRVKTKGWKN